MEHIRTIYIRKRKMREVPEFVMVYTTAICVGLSLVLGKVAIGICVCLFIISCIMCGISVKQKNTLLMEGKVIWATVETDKLWGNGNRIVFYLKYGTIGKEVRWKEERYIKNKYELEVRQKLKEFGRIPIIVNPQNESDYIVLMQEMIPFFLNREIESIARKDIIREIEVRI